MKLQLFCSMKVFGAKERFGSLTFAKRWLVCWAKGNVPNVGRLSAFLSCGSAKKLNLFSVIVISFFILKPFFFCHFRCRCLFLRLVGNSFICMTNSYKVCQIRWICMIDVIFIYKTNVIIFIYKSSKGDFIFCMLWVDTCVFISVVMEFLWPRSTRSHGFVTDQGEFGIANPCDYSRCPSIQAAFPP